MNILGISAFYHDAAACLLQEGRLVAAVQEERFSRVRFDPQLPVQSIHWCLAERGLRIDQIDLVAFYEKPLLKLDRVLDTFFASSPKGNGAFARDMHTWLAERLRLPDRLRQTVGWRGPIAYFNHHESHAASAFFPSPFQEAAVLTVDGVGEWTTNAVHAGRDNRVETLFEQQFPHSLGLLYAAFTEYLGFAVLADEYKVMGLAPYGEARFVNTILDEIIDLKEDGSFRLDLRAFAFLRGQESADRARFHTLFGMPPRVPGGPIESSHMDLARSVQAVCEEVMLKQARHAAVLTGARHLCMAGGVALNCVANGRILREGPFERIWIQPASGDAGGCVGAAFAAFHHLQGHPRVPVRPDGMSGALLGPAFGDDAVTTALSAAGLHGEELETHELLERTASVLAEGKVVGWFQGHLEFGPRALGARSILADPRLPNMQRRVNEKIKFREGFRPFAPAVLAEDAARWFTSIGVDAPSPYMLLVAPVHPDQLLDCKSDRVGLDRLGEVRSTIPAVTHVDGSARVQTVDEASQPLFHGLLRAFADRTDCPVLLNTSFNLNGEPIVCSPDDACRTFLASGIDVLVLGRRIVARPNPAPPPRSRAPQPPLPLTAGALRWFGAQVVIGLVALMLAIGPTRSGARTALAVLAGLLAVVSFAIPDALRPVARPWLRVAGVISGLFGGIFLRLVHVVFVMPVALFRSKPVWLGELNREARTHWIPFHRKRPPRYDRMY